MVLPISVKAAVVALALGSGVATTAAAAEPPPAPVALTVEHDARPLDVDRERPRLAWQSPAEHRGAAQTAYEVEVATGAATLAAGEADAWDSGRVPSSRSIEVPYAGAGLRSGTPYWWRVRTWDEYGRRSGWSDPARFETGFLDQADWSGSWIGRGGPWPILNASITPAPSLRKEFNVPQDVTRARLRVVGLGYNEVELNGEKVGDHVLDPAWTVFDRTVLYTTYDVTRALRRGDNALGVTLGRGYYAVPDKTGAPWELWRTSWNAEQKLLLQLDLEHADGTRSRVVSDGSWSVGDSPIVADDVNMGERYDARREQSGWSQPGFDDASWRPAVVVPGPGGRIRAAAMEPVRVTETLDPVAVTHPSAGVTLYDYGTVTAGWTRLRVRGAAGAQVTLQHGEKLGADGLLDNVRSGNHGPAAISQTDTYTLKGGGLETWEPRFVYHGFRYVQVKTTAGPPPEIAGVEARVAHQDVASAGGFASSQPLYETFDRAMRKTILNNLHGIPTDTPMYDKVGWTADGHLYADSAFRDLRMTRFYEKWMQDFADSQYGGGPIDGAIGGAVPAMTFIDQFFGSDPAWTGAYFQVNWDLYQYAGDVDALRRHYLPMTRLLSYWERELRRRGGFWIADLIGFGDWYPPGYPFGFAPEGHVLVETGYVIEAARVLARIARLLGRDDDAARHDAFVAEFARTFNDAFLDRDRGVYRTPGTPAENEYRQTSNLLPLYLGIVPDDVRRAVVDNLVRDVRDTHGKHLDTGAIGTRLLLPVLTDEGYGELANEVASQTTYPSWGYWFEALGADTMWEEWQADARSRDHPFMGTVDDWLSTHLAGLQPAGPGYIRTRVKPLVPRGVDHASTWTETPYGRVAAGWRRAGEGVDLRVEVPANTTAEVHVPARAAGDVTLDDATGARLARFEDGAAVYAVAAGDYRFRSAHLPGAVAPPVPPADPPAPPGELPRPPARTPGVSPRLPRAAPRRPAAIARRSVRVHAGGRAALRVRCGAPPSRTCRGTLRLAAGGRTVATRGFSVRTGRLTAIRVRLTPAAHRTLVRRGRLPVTATLAWRVGGERRTVRARVTLLAPRPSP